VFLLLASAHAGSQVFALTQDVEQPPQLREVTITARRYSVIPTRIVVTKGTIVRITLIAEDVPHGFALDEYRIAKRVSPGRRITFEFCADRAGRFTFYCGMTGDAQCRDMRGELIVE
jgi:heme/copper-type cytochrome/quinol oxidase subunit 2